jgi:methylase of polypeptide subunit release factors
MTFQQIVGLSKKKYHTTNEVVIFDILYSLSNLVKDKITFTQRRRSQIDFNKQTFYRLLDQYFTNAKPLGSITKKTQFYGLNIEIFTKIFNPRAETEFLCQKVIEILTKDRNLKSGLDLCCGTGAIGLAIKNNCP